MHQKFQHFRRERTTIGNLFYLKPNYFKLFCGDYHHLVCQDVRQMALFQDYKMMTITFLSFSFQNRNVAASSRDFSSLWKMFFPSGVRRLNVYSCTHTHFSYTIFFSFLAICVHRSKLSLFLHFYPLIYTNVNLSTW